MRDFYSRSYGIYGPSLDKIINSHVAVIGLGGVGGSAALCLARAGVGELTLIDGDFVLESNLNRQEIAFESTIGMRKVDACNRLIKDINKDIDVHLYDEFWSCESTFDLSGVDYIIDCIDQVKAKVDLIAYAKARDIPIISSMGAGNKIDPTGFVVTDISKTSVDPLARVVRRKLKERGIMHTKVVYSKETPIVNDFGNSENSTSDYVKRNAPSSASHVPPVVGYILAGHVLNELASLTSK